MANFLRALTAGKLSAWTIAKNDEIVVIMTTVVSHDTIADCKTFYVYTLFSVSPQDDETWLAILATLKQLAQLEGCWKVTARTNNPRMLEFCKQYMEVTPYWLVEKEV